MIPSVYNRTDVKDRPDVAELLRACRVPDSVRAGRYGHVWEVERRVVPVGLSHILPQGETTYVALRRITMATLHRDRGEVVMEDTLPELRRHLPILMRARGRVLVSGLGLGCVVRGLLAKPEVEHVDVVEIDLDVILATGGEFADDPRVRIRHGDALLCRWPADARWDFAWHDVWTEEAGRLDLLHAQLLARYRDRCGHQGAWQFDRRAKRRWPDPLVNSERRWATRRSA